MLGVSCRAAVANRRGDATGPVLSPCNQGDKVLGGADSVRAVEGSDVRSSSVGLGEGAVGLEAWASRRRLYSILCHPDTLAAPRCRKAAELLLAPREPGVSEVVKLPRGDRNCVE